MGDLRLAAGWYVEVVADATGAVVKRLGPFTVQKADRVERGMGINLDHACYFTRMVEVPAPAPTKKAGRRVGGR